MGLDAADSVDWCRGGPIPSPRRADVDAKQDRIAELLATHSCEGLLVHDPAGFAWLTAGATPSAFASWEERPLLYFTPQQRWLIASSVDSQRLFDEELSELGFQLKEWMWQFGRESLLGDLTRGRRLAGDFPHPERICVGPTLSEWRQRLTPLECDSLRQLGQSVAHALEATARNIEPGCREEQLAGQLGHRLLHRGVEPVCIEVLADGRGDTYRRARYTDQPVERWAAVQVIARKQGLHVMASRMVCFQPPSDAVRTAFDQALRLNAILICGTRPGVPVLQLLDNAARFLGDSDQIADWRRSPPGFVTGWDSVARPLGIRRDEVFQAGQVINWQTRLAGVVVSDTVLVTEQAADVVTCCEASAVRNFRIQGIEVRRPDWIDHSATLGSPNRGR
ncbi:M24 family metallopeptidase [Tuwongella immobilis]|uniref:Peptidase M24 domain-containing protein n=1 Tax=Tuwongella immobilis TaxID=692036 RepID=A0A6C2YUM4_9BACT